MTLSGMITSKDIIDVAGISRATLNNYIKSGILPRPMVGPPPAGTRGAKQIGYFPEGVLSRLEHVKQLKSQGKSMEEIVAVLVGTSRVEAQAAPAVQVEIPPATQD